MDEKVLIKSERYNLKKIVLLVITICIVLSICLFIYQTIESIRYSLDDYDIKYSQYLEHKEQGSCYNYNNYNAGEKCYACEYVMNTSKDQAVWHFFPHDGWWVCLIILVAPIFIGSILFLFLGGAQLTVTDKRAYGQSRSGKRVDLPIDSISSISEVRFLRGVSISTASGNISFYALKNSADIYKIISEILIERQNNKNFDKLTVQTLDTADQLKKYKELLDIGAISQEEFEAKKKQILGL